MSRALEISEGVLAEFEALKFEFEKHSGERFLLVLRRAYNRGDEWISLDSEYTVGRITPPFLLPKEELVTNFCIFSDLNFSIDLLNPESKFNTGHLIRRNSLHTELLNKTSRCGNQEHIPVQLLIGEEEIQNWLLLQDPSATRTRLISQLLADVE